MYVVLFSLQIITIIRNVVPIIYIIGIPIHICIHICVASLSRIKFYLLLRSAIPYITYIPKILRSKDITLPIHATQFSNIPNRC